MMELFVRGIKRMMISARACGLAEGPADICMSTEVARIAAIAEVSDVSRFADCIYGAFRLDADAVLRKERKTTGVGVVDLQDPRRLTTTKEEVIAVTARSIQRPADLRPADRAIRY